MPKNIILCCDGTNNQFAGNQTNVLRLFRSSPQITNQQVTFYDPGVGTMPAQGVWTKIGKRISVLFGLAIGLGFTKNLTDTYSFLVERFEPGDKVFLFGFSRGAYTARAVAAMLHAVGLIRPGTENLAPYAVRYWRNSYTKEGAKVAADFKRTMARECKPHFIGVWDTVGSVGWINNFQAFPYTHHNPEIEVFRQAVSIDERRCCFLQNLFEADPRSPNQNIENVWFAGVHSDVGGGYPDAESGLSQVAFQWLMREARAAGLIIDEDILAIQLGQKPNAAGVLYSRPDPTGILHKSLSGGWWLLEILPRKIWDPKAKEMRWAWRPAAPRAMMANPLVHVSVDERKSQVPEYRPLNLPTDYSVIR